VTQRSRGSHRPITSGGCCADSLEAAGRDGYSNSATNRGVTPWVPMARQPRTASLRSPSVAQGDLSRSQRKKFAAAEAVAGPGASVLAYGDGVGHARFPKSAMWIVRIFFAVFIESNRIVFPGLLLADRLSAFNRGGTVFP
jgi:hypothetical protein